MANGQKTIEIVAGPNGSGKTTFAESFFLSWRKTPIFINPDQIASGISPLNPKLAAFHAGRIMLTSVKEQIQLGNDFAFESTLSGKTWLPILEQARKKGYQIRIYFLCLSGVRENLKRIQTRVKAGGHHIPAKTVYRRYPRSFRNFWYLYRPLSTYWCVLNNSGRKPIQVHSIDSFDLLEDNGKAEFARRFSVGKLK